MFNSRNRASLIVIAAGYLCYLAYGLYEGMNDPLTTMPAYLSILFILLFILAAIGLCIYAWKIWHKKDETEEKKEPDHNSLK